MNRDLFEQKILRQLKEHSSPGNMINDMGTRLIGHTPQIAPKAYQHIVYAPLGDGEIKEFEERLERPAPFQLTQFLSCANGMIIFSGALRVMGYVPMKRVADTHIHNYPPNIIVYNVSARIKGLRARAVIVGFYKSDGSYVSVEFDGKAVRFDAKGDGRAIRKWANFDSWLVAEIARYTGQFNNKDNNKVPDQQQGHP